MVKTKPWEKREAWICAVVCVDSLHTARWLYYSKYSIISEKKLHRLKYCLVADVVSCEYFEMDHEVLWKLNRDQLASS